MLLSLSPSRSRQLPFRAGGVALYVREVSGIPLPAEWPSNFAERAETIMQVFIRALALAFRPRNCRPCVWPLQHTSGGSSGLRVGDGDEHAAASTRHCQYDAKRSLECRHQWHAEHEHSQYPKRKYWKPSGSAACLGRVLTMLASTRYCS